MSGGPADRAGEVRWPDLGELTTDPRQLTPADLDASILRLERLRDAAGLDARVRTDVLRGLVSRLWVRYERGGNVEDRDRARTIVEEAAAAWPPDSEERELWASGLGSMGVAMLMRYREAQQQADLDSAIDFLDAAASAVLPNSPAWAAHANDLANALVERFKRAQNDRNMVTGVLAESDLERAIALLEDALVPSAEDPDLRRAALGSLGQAFMVRCRRALELEELEEAIPALDSALVWLREAVDALPGPSLARVEALTDLGRALALRRDAAGDLSALDDAITRLTEARTLGESLDVEIAPTLAALASALAHRFDTARGQPADFDAAAECFRDAIAQSGRGDPSGALELALWWGEWAMRHAAWTSAVESFASALKLIERLLAGHLVDVDRSVTVGWARDIARNAAYAAALAGDPRAAVVGLERGRGLLFEHELRSRLPAEALADVVFGDVAAAAQRRPVAYFVPTTVGGLALLVRRDGDVRTILLPELAVRELDERVGRYWASHRVAAEADPNVLVVGSAGIEDAAPRMGAIDDLTEWIWHAAMRPLTTALESEREVTIIATGGLAIAPLHAAWRPDASAATRRRYALDDVQLTYAPSVRALRRPSTPLGDGLLAIQDPTPTKTVALEGSAIEVAAARGLASDVLTLEDGQATRDAVLGAMRNRRFLHFSTHGFADPVEPLNGGLVMAGDEVLTVADVMDQRLDGVELAVLAACETAWPDTWLPDESIGLPAAFLLAGAAGVLGSLWRVPTVATAMLLAKFYAVWSDDPPSPAAALRVAQRWVRDTTNAEKRHEFPDLQGFDPPAGAASRRLWESARSHANPYFWAGFIYIGP